MSKNQLEFGMIVELHWQLGVVAGHDLPLREKAFLSAIRTGMEKVNGDTSDGCKLPRILRRPDFETIITNAAPQDMPNQRHKLVAKTFLNYFDSLCEKQSGIHR